MRAWTIACRGVLPLCALAAASCGYSRHPSSDAGLDAQPDGAVDAGPEELDAATDSALPDAAACGVVDPCPPDDADADDDGIPDGFDREPDTPQPTVEDEDFGDDPGWQAEGDGSWSLSPEGWAVQSGECDDRGGAATFEPMGGVALADLYVEAKVRVPACPDQVEGHGAGVFARKADGRLVACLFSPTTPEEDDPEDTSGRAEMRVVVFEGEDIATATAQELGSQFNTVQMNDDDAFMPGPHWGDKWVTVRLLLDPFDVVCEVRPGDSFDSWGLTWTGTSPDLPAGTAGLVTWGASATFDRFRVVALE